MKAMKVDLYDRTFPHFLASLAGGTKAVLDTELGAVAAGSNETAPTATIVVRKVPIPGMAAVEVAVTPEASGNYAAAVKDVFEKKLGSKSLVLKLLGSVGVS